MRECDIWLYTETAYRKGKIAVVHEAGAVHLRRIIWSVLGTKEGKYTVVPLGSGKTFYQAYKDARKKGRIRRRVS